MASYDRVLGQTQSRNKRNCCLPHWADDDLLLTRLDRMKEVHCTFLLDETSNVCTHERNRCMLDPLLKMLHSKLSNFSRSRPGNSISQ